ncbi:MAG: hypothetical protein L0387_30610 [Acidobacteria bacterium]|nr:hypothetical protein [Acidobacteriota bacterium]MCI0721549.1 hypothetical protein [Acidobacteriota bacterium]
MKALVVGSLLLGLVSRGEQQERFSYWPARELVGYGERLAPKMDSDKRGLEELANFGSHSVLMVYRESSADPVAHDGTDFYVVQNGKATLVLGGELVERRRKKPGEFSGSSIRGGKRFQIRAGDAINIPPQMPHEIILEPGEFITYLVVKIP